MRTTNWIRWASVAFAATLVPLLLWRSTASAPATAAVVLVEAGLIVAVVFRKKSLTLFGPLFFYDIVRFGRRGRNQLLRVLCGLLLLGGVWCAFATDFPNYNPFEDPLGPGPSATLASRRTFATKVGLSILAAQAVLVVMLTPAFLASAIAEEKEKHTLEFLFTTSLVDREIVVGKMLARVFQLTTILLIALPVILFLGFLSGMEQLGVLLAGFSACAIGLLSVGSISVLWSVLCRQVFTALVGAYAVIIPAAVLGIIVPISTPIAFVTFLESSVGGGILHKFFFGSGFAAANAGPVDLPLVFIAYVTFHGLIAVTCAAFAVRQLRSRALGEVVKKPRSVRNKPAPIRAAHPPARRPRKTHAVTDWPLLWKEIYHQAHPFLLAMTLPKTYFVVLFGVGLCGVVPWALLFCFAPAEILNNVVFGINLSVRTATIVFAGMWCTLVGLRVAGSVTRERQQQTLGNLLVLAVPRWRILAAKCLGCVLRYRIFAACLAAVWTVGLATTALHPLAVCLLAVACTVHLAFLAWLGVWISLSSRNTLWAYCSMIMMLMLVFLGWWLVQIYAQFFFGLRPGGAAWWNQLVEVGLNPPRTWWQLGFSWTSDRPQSPTEAADAYNRFTATLAGLGTLAAAAGACAFVSLRSRLM